MRVEEVITRIREDYLDDTLGVDEDDPLVTDSSLLRFANEAQVQACRRDDVIFDDTTALTCTITLVEDQRAYDYSALITRFQAVFHNGLELTKINEEMLDRNYAGWRVADSSTPTHYYVKSRKLYLYPEPNATAAAITLDLSINRLPIETISEYSDEFEIFDEAQEDLVYWMLYRVYNLRDEDLFDPAAADYYLDLFTQTYGDVIPLDVRMHMLEDLEILQHIPGDKYHFTGHAGDDPDFDSTGWQ